MLRELIMLAAGLTFLTTSFSACAKPNLDDYSIHVYTRSDAAGAAEVWAKYLGNYKQEDLKGTAVFGDPGLTEAVRKDRLGIGYNNIGYAYDTQTGEQLEGIMVIPIDTNENGKIDENENFYSKKDLLVKATLDGRYPSPPARDLYVVTRDRFTGVTCEFVRWILQDGQKYTGELGYVALPDEKISAELKRLAPPQTSGKMKGIITISGAFALYPMIGKWAEEFQKIYPEVKFDISAGGAGKGMTDALNGMVDIGMISREINPAEIQKGAAWIAVTKDAVVATANRNNPLAKDLAITGIKKQAFKDIWITETISDWRNAIK